MMRMPLSCTRAPTPSPTLCQTRLLPWVNGQGNPTRSGLVNDVIRKLKQYEVRGVAREGQDKRPVTQQEFIKLLELLKERRRGQNTSSATL